MNKSFFLLLVILIGMCCFSFSTHAQMQQMRFSGELSPGRVPDYVGDKNKDLNVHIVDKETLVSDPEFDKKIRAVRLYNGDDTIIIPKDMYSYWYQGQLKDTVYVEVEAEGYRKEKMIFIPKLFIANEEAISRSSVVYISKKDYYPNEIIVINNDIEINLGKEKTVFDASQLRQSPDEPIKQTLCRIPGWELKKNAVYFKGQKLDYFFINGEFVHVVQTECFMILFSTFKKYMKNK